MNENKMKIRIDESKSLVFHLKKERIPLPTSNEELSIDSSPEPAVRQQPPETSDHQSDGSKTPSIKKEPRFQYINSNQKTKALYQKILLQIPQWKGTALVYGIIQDERHALEICRSEENLRKEFARQIKKINNRHVDRFTWMENLLLSKSYQQIKIYYSSSF